MLNHYHVMTLNRIIHIELHTHTYIHTHTHTHTLTHTLTHTNIFLSVANKAETPSNYINIYILAHAEVVLK